MLAKGLYKPWPTVFITNRHISLNRGHGNQKIRIFGNAVWYTARILHTTGTRTICSQHCTLHLRPSTCLDKEDFRFANKRAAVVSIKWGGDVTQETYFLITSQDTSLTSMTHHATDKAVSMMAILTVIDHELFYFGCGLIFLDFNPKAQIFKQVFQRIWEITQKKEKYKLKLINYMTIYRSTLLQQTKEKKINRTKRF